MERLMLDRLAGVVDREVRARFPAGTVRRVALLQSGDDPQIGPDELLVRVFIEASGGPVDYQRLLDAWARAHETRMKRMRRELSLRLPLGCAKFLARFGRDALKFVNSRTGRELRLRGLNARIVVPGTIRAGDVISKLPAAVAESQADLVRA